MMKNLCLTNLYKIGEDGKFIINRSQIPANVSCDIEAQISDAAQKIADATKCDVVQVVGGTIVLFRINLMLRQRAAEKKKRAKEKAEKEAIKRRTERKKRKYGGQ